MTCDEVRPLLGAHADGETTQGVTEHLGGCPDCRAALEAEKLQSQALREALGPYAESARRTADQYRWSSPERSASGRRVWLFAAAATAGFLAAAILLERPEPKGEDAKLQELARERNDLSHEVEKLRAETARVKAEQDRLARRVAEMETGGLGRLVYLLGTLEIKTPSGWGPGYIGYPLSRGAEVRTGVGSKAAFHMSDGSEVRLNEGTRISFDQERSTKLAAGEAWARVRPAKDAFTVATRDGVVEVLGTEIDVRVEERYTTVFVLEGGASFDNGTGACRLAAGQAAVADRIAVVPATVRQMERAVKWMLDIVASRGRDNPELDRHIAKLFEQMGQTKVEFLKEEEIKSYGSTCTIPIARYIQTPECRQEPAKRLKAVRILADIGDWYAVDAYISLLEDPDGEIRKHAARGLERVTGQNFGRSPAYWASGADRGKAIADWKGWWAQARSGKVTDDLERQLEMVKKKFEK